MYKHEHAGAGVVQPFPSRLGGLIEEHRPLQSLQMK